MFWGEMSLQLVVLSNLAVILHISLLDILCWTGGYGDGLDSA